jgi:predicted exporter
MKPGVGRSLVALAIVGAIGLIIASQLEFRADLSFVFPDQVSERTRFLTDRLSDRGAQGTFLMAIEGGGDEGARQRLSLKFSRALGATGSFERVANGAGIVMPNGFEYLFENRYLLGPAWELNEEFSPAFIADSLRRNLALLSTSAGQLLRRYLPADPTARGRAILVALSPASHPASQGGVWVSRDGGRALIVARARTENFDLDRQAVLLGEIRRLFTQLPGAEGHELRIAGPPGFAVATRDRIQNDVRILSGVSFLLILLLAWGGFRRPMLLILLGLPMGIGILAGLAVVQAVFGFVHGITLAFGACLVGIAIDYPLHVLAHAARDGDTAQSARAIWPTLRLSAITTVAAFVPFMLADFPGLAQIGLFVAAGLVAAVLAGRFLFPFLCPTVTHFPLSDSVVERLRRLAAKLRVPLTLLPIAALAVLALRWETVWETDLRALSPVPRDMVALDRDLRSGLGAPDVRYLIAVRGESAEEVLVRQESLRPLLRSLSAGEQISSWRMAADLLPSVAEQRRRQAGLPASDDLRRRLAEAVAGTAFRSGVFDPFLADVERMRTASPITFDAMARGDTGDLVKPWLSPRPGGFTGVVMLTGLGDPGIVATAIGEAAASEVEFVDLKHETERLVQSFLGSSILWLLGSVLAVQIVLYSGLRRVTAMARVMGPVLIAVTATLGLLAALGVPISVFHILSLILVAGLGMDYGLFFSRHGDEGTVTFRATILCNLTTASVFFVMAFSSIPVLHGIGLTVAAGSFLALVASAAFARSAE